MIQHYVYIYIYYSVQDQYSSTAQRDGAWCMDGRANPLMHGCVVRFDFEMCFAPQRCALVQHLNFQKCSGRELLLSLLTSTCAWRHNGVQFFISHLLRWLRTRRFSEPTFRPSGALKQCFATFLPFRAPWCSFYWLVLFWLFLCCRFLVSGCSHHCCCICP